MISKYLIPLLLNSVCGKIAPPTTGKFFYVDFPTFSTYGQHAIYASIKDKGGETDHGTSSLVQGGPAEYTSYPMFISTVEKTIGLFSNECPEDKCLIKQPGLLYDPSKSATYNAIEERAAESEVVAVYDRDDYVLQSV